jgi:PAT family beta-lactamase induction signal transducer AmpG
MEQIQSPPSLGWRVYLEKKVLIMLALGFSSGLPLLLVFGTLSFWLREAQVSRADIGFFSWVALAYGFKWVWSPLIDRFPIPIFSKLLGRRRGWLLFAQLMIVLSLCGMAYSDPEYHLYQLAIFALIVAFSSASQDIVIDAYRIELATEQLQAALAAAYMTGYRLAMIMAGAGTLAFAALLGTSSNYDATGWQHAYLIMAACMSVGIITTLVIHEPQTNNQQMDGHEHDLRNTFLAKGMGLRKAKFMAWFYTAAVMPFKDFFSRYGKHALLILALIGTYRLTDVVMGVMANAFYVDMGFTKMDVASISKVFGVIMTLVGAGFGGILVNKYGTLRILAVGAVLAFITNLLFVVFSYVGDSVSMLALVISADNLASGIGTAAFITYISSLTNVAFSATQYALFSSIMLLLPKFLAGFSGVFVDHFGYNWFFFATSMLSIPVLILIYLVHKHVKPI